jgi:hypothetical protein
MSELLQSSLLSSRTSRATMPNIVLYTDIPGKVALCLLLKNEI